MKVEFMVGTNRVGSKIEEIVTIKVRAYEDYRSDIEAIGRIWAEGTIIILSHVNQHNSTEDILNRI